MYLTTAEKIKIIAKRKGITITELGKRLNIGTQNMSNQLKRDNFTEKQLKNIAKALGCEYVSDIIVDGKSII